MAPFFMYVGISLLYASVAGALVSFVEPLAAGSGIAEVKTYLNGIHIRGLLAVSIANQAASLHCPHQAFLQDSKGLHGHAVANTRGRATFGNMAVHAGIVMCISTSLSMG